MSDKPKSDKQTIEQTSEPKSNESKNGKSNKPTNKRTKKTSKSHVVTVDPSLKLVCRDFMKERCTRDNCKFVHDTKLCLRYYERGSCKYGEHCRKNHFVTPTVPTVKESKRERRGDNLLESSTDLRLMMDSGDGPCKRLSNKDVILVPKLFSDYKMGELLGRLIDETKKQDKSLFQLWHNDCHYIADDKKNWKGKVPSFQLIIDRIKQYFNIRVEATRLNVFRGKDQFKYYHHDRASFNSKAAEKQNFTICLNLGRTRTIGFRHEKTKAIVTIPVSDGQIYCFSSQVNIDWEHAVLKDEDTKRMGEEKIERGEEDIERMSIVVWGWMDGIKEN